MQKNKLRLIAVILLFLVTLSPIMTVYAHDTIFLQVLIDKGSMTYVGNVIVDKSSTFNVESSHAEAIMGDFQSIKLSTPGIASPIASKLPESALTAIQQNAEFDIYKGSGWNGMIFSFPTMEQDNKTTKQKNNAGKSDSQRALTVSDVLIPSLNEALYLVNDSKPFSSVDELVVMSKKIRANGVVNGWTLRYGTYAGIAKNENNNDYDYDPNTGFCYATITKGTEKYKFVYLMPKGYITLNQMPGWDTLTEKERLAITPLAYTGIDYSNLNASGEIGKQTDTTFISWHQLTVQANYAYFVRGISTEYSGEFRKPEWVETVIVNAIDSCFNGLRSLLGLYSTEDLIYNDGTRSSFIGGIMSNQWYKTVIQYHLLFQAIAWLIITFSIAKALILRNISTVNPNIRADLMETIQNLLISGFMLSNIFPVVNMLMSFNEDIVRLFASQISNLGSAHGNLSSTYSNALSGAIMSIFYFCIDLYMNFTYIMRSLTIAILIASGPLFVVAIAFGGRYKELFETWMKELVANIFLQSFHAFVFAFFTSIQSLTRGLEGFVVAFAMIPMTEFFRGIVIGNSGSVAHNMGSKALGSVASMVQGVSNESKKNSSKTGGSQSGEGNGMETAGGGFKDYGSKDKPKPDGGGDAPGSGGGYSNKYRKDNDNNSSNSTRDTSAPPVASTNPAYSASSTKGATSTADVEKSTANIAQNNIQPQSKQNRITPRNSEDAVKSTVGGKVGTIAKSLGEKALKGAPEFGMNAVKTMGAIGIGMATGDDSILKMAGQNIGNSSRKIVGGVKSSIQGSGNRISADTKQNDYKDAVNHDMAVQTSSPIQQSSMPAEQQQSVISSQPTQKGGNKITEREAITPQVAVEGNASEQDSADNSVISFADAQQKLISRNAEKPIRQNKQNERKLLGIENRLF